MYVESNQGGGQPNQSLRARSYQREPLKTNLLNSQSCTYYFVFQTFGLSTPLRLSLRLYTKLEKNLTKIEGFYLWGDRGYSPKLLSTG